MKNISQYNWNWWFMISIFLLFSTLFTATVINGNGWATAAIIVTLINMLCCLYVGGKSGEEEDLTDEEIAEAFRQHLEEKRDTPGITNPFKEVDMSPLQDITFTDKKYSKEDVERIVRLTVTWTDNFRREYNGISIGLSTKTAEEIEKDFDVEKWVKEVLA